VNLYLHNFGDPKIHEYDTLSQEDRRNEDYDCILANPPFMTPKGGIQPHKRFSIQANKSEVLFVDYIMEHLKINGKAGVIVPEGIIFQSATAYKALRKKMIEEKYLRAVVSLPSGVFQPYSGVKTSILLFDKQIAKKTDKILFIKANHDGFDLGAQRRVAGYEYNTEDVKIKLDPFLQQLAHADHVTGQKSHDKIVYEIAGKKQEIPLFVKNDLPMAYYALVSWKQMLMADNAKAEENVLLNNIASGNLVTLVDKAQIIESGDYNLSVERYRENIISNSDRPMVELGKVCEIQN
jgi:type I restriction enzyme M protein